LAAQDLSGRRLEAAYRRRLKEGFVLADLERLKLAPHLVLSDRVQHRYPQFVCDIVEEIFTVSNPAPKPRLRSLVFGQARKAGIRWRDLVRDAWTSWRMLG
jgi:electron transfer flavoprotein-quinone oxidoreductase